MVHLSRLFDGFLDRMIKQIVHLSIQFKLVNIKNLVYAAKNFTIEISKLN
jgi:hypothetical protein